MDSTQDLTRKDALISVLAANGDVRITAADCKDLVEEARRIHDLSRVATAALGRQLVMTLIMASELKHETDRVSTIIKGDGPGGSMVCTGKPDLTVKGTILHPNVELAPTAAGKLDVGGLVGREGTLTVVRDLSLKEPYVGRVNLVSGEIAEDFTAYYAQSQQQPSIVYLGVRVHPEQRFVRAAGGILVQPLPNCPDATLDALQALAPRITTLAKALDEGRGLWDIVSDVFGSLEPELVLTQTPCYRCDCSRERIMQALISVGREELTAMIEEDHGAEVQCHFCNQRYRFSEAQLKQLLWSATKGEHDDSERG